MTKERTTCPDCHTPLGASIVEHDKGVMYEEKRCSDCGRRWMHTWELTSVEEVAADDGL